jgi:hypothetical protein
MASRECKSKSKISVYSNKKKSTMGNVSKIINLLPTGYLVSSGYRSISGAQGWLPLLENWVLSCFDSQVSIGEENYIIEIILNLLMPPWLLFK